MAKNKLYLIDATAFCYRAFYALGGLATSFGQPTNAIYGFLNILNKILKEKKPDLLAACFDVSRDTFRQKKFADYKIQRPPMPEGLTSQIPLIKEIISAYRIQIFEKKGFEADDIIATLAKKAKKEGLAVVIVSSDKDLLQLVDEEISVFSPYKDAGLLYDKQKVVERLGVEPKKIPEIIALIGDAVDNIPGAGITEKAAVKLINKFESLEKILENADKIEEEKIRHKVIENIDQIRLSQELAVLDDGIDLDFDLDKLKPGEPDYKELFRLFKHLEFKSFLKGLPAQEEASVEVQVSGLKDRDLKGLSGSIEELFVSGERLDDAVFYAADRFFRLEDNGPNIKNILADPKIKKSGHDLKKIKVALEKTGIVLAGLCFDTMIAAYLVNPSKSEYSLASLALDFLGKFSSKAMDNQKAIGLLPDLKVKLEQELNEKSLAGLFVDLEMPLVEVLARMELNGIKLDLEALRKLSRDLEKRLIKLIAEIYDLSGCQFNINSPKQLREVLFVKLKLPVVKKGKTGPSTDEEVLRNLASSHKLPASLLEYRQLTKLKSTYIDALPELVNPDTGRVHTSFNQTGTETGRLSSSNPNLQNIPVKTDIGGLIRKAIIASEKDHLLLSCDYSQIELRILAHMAHDEELIRAFKEDKDIHRITASLIYGLDEKDVTDPMREVAKRVNFGIVYGLTSYGLARDLHITQEQAQDFIDAYFLRYPKVKVYMEEEIKKAQKFGYVMTLMGRKRYIPEIKDKNQGIRQFAERKAINTPIQGSVSDLIKLAMIQIHQELNSAKFKAKMILQIHDELVFDLPENELKAFVPMLRDRMENVLKLDVPIRASIKQGKNWLEMEEVK